MAALLLGNGRIKGSLPATAANLNHLPAIFGLRSLGSKADGRVAVRRETKNRWERRAPLTPRHVKTLRRNGIDVVVQPSPMRVFTDDMYVAAGATLQEDISDTSIILGVKEVPLDQILPDKTYLCFSHTIKAQPYNMKLLDTMLESNVRLIDYERMLDEDGKRVIGFGRFAGNAGMIDLLRGFGDRLLGLGYSNPFLGMGYSDYYHSLAASKTAIQLVGINVTLAGMPKKIGPAVFAFTGKGQVTEGALEVFKELPHEFIMPSDLPTIAEKGDLKTIYGVMLEKSDLAQRKDGAAFNNEDYKANPEAYEGVFHSRIAPYITALVNGMYWDAQYPRLLTVDQMENLQKSGQSRLLAIADISADPNGSIEFMEECTTIDRPFLIYNPMDRTSKYDWEAEGVLLGSVDNLPAELPIEASNHFGDLLLPYVYELAQSDGTLPFDQQTDISDTLRNAVITNHGELTDNYKYIAELRAQNPSPEKKILVLGSGMVAPPLVDYLATTESLQATITVASLDEAAGAKLAEGHENVSSEVLDLSNRENVAKVVAEHDIVVSLVPAPFHAGIAEICIDAGVDMVTTSYVSPEMEALNDKAKAAGVTIMNEVGLDPGIDHLAAVETITDVQENGGQITSFVSWCGGLPCPEAATNPLGYKFSWSAKGVLTAGLNQARYREHAKEKQIESGHLFHKGVRDIGILPAFALEGVPNRDSLTYADLYGITSAETVLRGTLRYKGFGDIMSTIQDLGFCSTVPRDNDTTWNAIAEEANVKPSQTVRKALKRLGLLSNTVVPKGKAPIDVLSDHLSTTLVYEDHERDLVILSHEFEVQNNDGSKETRLMTLVKTGEAGGPTAMSQTVGLPAAIATAAITRGIFEEEIGPGVHRPLNLAFCKHILKELDEGFGIHFHETREAKE